MQTALAVTQIVVAIAMVVTAVAAVLGIKSATEQARASGAQANSSEQMARLSLQQTELIRTQLHASFRPVVEVIGSEKGTQSATLTLKNVGTSPALSLMAVCRSGWQQNLGSLAPESMRVFCFNYSFNLSPPPPLFSPVSQGQLKPDVQQVPLRLEYASASGAKCWTNVRFKVGGDGPLEPEFEHGMDLPPFDLKS